MKRYKNYKDKKGKKRDRKEEPKGLCVALRDGESVDQLIRRFKRIVESAGIIKEVKRREYYLSPSQKVRDKKKKALKRLRKRMKAAQRYKVG